jgi:DNA-binding NarL/FixJ family response regulator
MFLDGLRLILEREPDIAVVGQAVSAAQAIALALETRPDIILMAATLGNDSGVEAAKRIGEVMPDAKIIAVTMHKEDAVIADMLGAGALGYVLKHSGAEELLHVIRVVAAGGVAISPGAASAFLAHYHRSLSPDADPAFRLSARELEVLRLAALGAGNKQIASALSVSTYRINKIFGEIYDKLGVNSRIEAVTVAIAKGLLHRKA